MRVAAARAVLARAAGAPAAASASCPGSCRRPPPRSARARRRAPRRRPCAARSTSSSSRSEPFWKGDSRAVHRSSSTQERPMPAIVALVAQQRVEVAGLVEQRRELLERRRRVGVRARASPPPRPRDLVGGQQLRPGALLGAELAQAQLAAVVEPDQQPRGAVAQRRALVEQLQPAGRHQVDEQRQVAGLDDEHLADAPHAVQLAAGERVERRVERLQRDHARRQRGLDARARDAGRQAARGDLDFGQLGHAPRVGWTR